MAESRHLTSAKGPWTDNVARWQKLQQDFPEARHVFDAPWFYGALRDTDDVIRESDLGRLIDRLMAREQTPRPWGLVARAGAARRRDVITHPLGLLGKALGCQ